MLQRCCYFLLVSFGSSIRTGLQPPSDIVRNLMTRVSYADNRSAELEMTVNMLIQIDKLVQLLESPVFTCRRIMCISRDLC